MNNDKSKKNKSTLNKTKLWNIFETEIKNTNKPEDKLECLYRVTGNREFCDMCDSSLSFSAEGFLTCVNVKCGIIYKDMLDHSPEWRFYGADDKQNSDPTRCGMPINPLLEESSYGCKVLCGGKTSYEMRKIRRYTEWQSMPYKEKTIYEDFQLITMMASIAGIPKIIIDEAMRKHKQITEYNKTFRGDNKDGLLAASIYISCRIYNYPRTAKELATIFHLDPASATHGCKNAQLIINHLEQNLDNNDKTIFYKTKPEAFIERYCSRLNMNTELTKLCQFIAVKIEKLGHMPENTPHSIAAGIIYFISNLFNLNICKKDVKNVSNISEVTINKCYKKMEQMTQSLVPAVILNKYGIIL